jgi:aminoglycoside phosphotransferase family enzyme/predicted kinase
VTNSEGARPGVAETHSAYVFFVGDRAYKLKKPVDLGFLDFTTREAREAVCHREVELNRRLAPDVYLGVADVHDPNGTLCDHLVVMRRMPVARRLSALLAADAPVDGHLRRLAHLLAAFHARSGRSSAADLEAGVDATRRRWQDNTDALLRIDPLHNVGPGIEFIQGMADRYLDGRAKLFATRIDDGRAVDGHGDLLADDIFCLDDGPRVLDCIEFDERLRLGDGLADAAFLAMDLEHLGHPDLALRFLDAYREHRDDVWPASLAHHHIAYRAQVRAKVAAIRAGQLSDSNALDDAHELLELANAHLEAARVRLVVVGGLPGTGKSTIARAVGQAFEARVLHSDHIRKELAGMPTDLPAPGAFGQGLYADAHTTLTYEALLERAAIGLEMGETVVVDASWTSDAWRQRARAVAEGCHADLIELRCVAPVALAERRIVGRAIAGGDASDATVEIADVMRAKDDPWPQATAIDTERSVERSTADAVERVGQPTNPLRFR